VQAPPTTNFHSHPFFISHALTKPRRALSQHQRLRCHGDRMRQLHMEWPSLRELSLASCVASDLLRARTGGRGALYSITGVQLRSSYSLFPHAVTHPPFPSQSSAPGGGARINISLSRRGWPDWKNAARELQGRRPHLCSLLPKFDANTVLQAASAALNTCPFLPLVASPLFGPPSLPHCSRSTHPPPTPILVCSPS